MIPLRLVIDTNVIVSAALKPQGLQRTTLLLAITQPLALFVSEPVVAEYRAVLSRSALGISKARRQQILQLIENRARYVKPRRKLQVATDPSDNIFVECADEARADYLITGNVRHFPSFWKKTKIITTRQFLDLLAPHLLP